MLRQQQPHSIALEPGELPLGRHELRLAQCGKLPGLEDGDAVQLTVRGGEDGGGIVVEAARRADMSLEENGRLASRSQ